jgi:hypothetical protein
MPVIVKKPSLKTDFFNPTDIENAIKVYSSGFTSIADVCNLLAKLEIPPSRVTALQKGKDNRDGVLLILSNKDDVEKVRSSSSYVVGHKTLNIVALNKQLVHYRVHWLPAYLSVESVKSIFEDYGHIIEVKYDFSHYGQNNNKIKNGIFSVTAEVTEIQRREFPHLVEFDCGNACLITGGGRPPLCLLCKKVGHIKKNVP